MFKLIVNGDPEHELTRSFGWQGEAAEYKRVLQANEFVTTIDVVDRLAGNDPVTLKPILRTARVFTRDASLRHVRPADRKRAAAW